MLGTQSLFKPIHKMVAVIHLTNYLKLTSLGVCRKCPILVYSHNICDVSSEHQLASLMSLENSFEKRVWFLIPVVWFVLQTTSLQEWRDLCFMSPSVTEPYIVNEPSSPLVPSDHVPSKLHTQLTKSLPYFFLAQPMNQIQENFQKQTNK